MATLVLRPRLFALSLLAALLPMGGAAYHYWPWREIRHGAGVIVAPAEPLQTMMAEYNLGTVQGYEINALAQYTITARVLSTRRYRRGPGSDLVPIDLALGWGRMSDEAVLDRLSVSQSFRFYFTAWKGEPPIPSEEIATHSANTHIIPATPEIARTIFGLHRGAVVTLTGQLVTAALPGGPVWRSSISRADTGAGACELMYVESATEVTGAIPQQP